MERLRLNPKNAKGNEDLAAKDVAVTQPAAAMRSNYRMKIQSDSPPLPEGGMDAFNKYVREETGPINGETIIVESSFIVKTGGITDSIRVLNYPPQKHAEEAIRLIRSGPAWKPAVRNGRVVDEEVRLKIELPAVLSPSLP